VERNSLSTKRSYSSVFNHFQNFLSQDSRYTGCNCDTVLERILDNKVNVYELLDHFISFLVATKPHLTHQSIFVYVVAMKSYFAYHDIDIIPAKFKRRVKIPKSYRQDEDPLDASDIRKILLAASNRRLKLYLEVLASGGMRATEGLAIRICDIDFSTSPTKIHIRKEFAKTRVARDIYISDEATQYLKQWIAWKYRDRTDSNKKRHRVRNDSDLVFAVYEIKRKASPYILYKRIIKEFQKTLATIGMDRRKEGSGAYRRRKITIHSFRRFVKTVISDQTNQDYSEWFLGHSKSPYWTKKESERREIYATKCMKYLTFLDYTTLEARGKSIEANLQEKEREIEELRHNDKVKEDALATLSDQVMKLMVEVQELKKQK
jgi:integrase